MKRGDVVLLSVPYLSGSAAKNRPALIVQTDATSAKLNSTIIAAISSNIRHADEPFQLFIDPAVHPASGLRQPSVVRCDRLFTVEQADVTRVLGELAADTMQQVKACLIASLGIS